MLLQSITSLLVGELLLLGDGEGVDAEEVADGVDNQESPSKVHDEGKDEVGPEV